MTPRERGADPSAGTGCRPTEVPRAAALNRHGILAPMRVWHSLDEVDPDFGPSVVTIGNFDGVHRGHQEVLAQAKARAAELGGLPVVALTFDPHPMAVLRPDRAPAMLSEPVERAELLGNHGAEAVLILPFDRDVASWSPEE